MKLDVQEGYEYNTTVGCDSVGGILREVNDKVFRKTNDKNTLGSNFLE